MKYTALLAVAAALSCGSMPSYADTNEQTAPTGLVNFRGISTDSWGLIGVDDPRCIGIDLYLTWSEIEPEEGKFNWSDLDAQMAPWLNAGKKVALRFSTGGHRVQETPDWVFQSGVRRIVCRNTPFADFETDDEMQLSSGAVLSSEAISVISGQRSAVLPDPSAQIATKPSLIVSPSEGMIAAFDAQMPSDGTITVKCVSADGKKSYLEKSFTLIAGKKATLEWDFISPNTTGCKLVWQASGSASIDNILVARRSLRQYTYPVYWQPEFRDKLSAFITAVANKYGNNPNILYFNINGIGRWEEAMIDTGDNWDDTSAKRQWLAQGYNQKDYLEQVKWSMDTWRKAAPQAPLCLMVAYAMKNEQNETWNWYRLADEAAKRGVMVKQNGLSGKYSEWHDTTQFSWIAQRMRGRTSLVYEPATGPETNGLGNCATFINRALQDAPSILTWYSPSMQDTANQAALDIAAAALGKGDINTFYCLLRPMEAFYGRKGDRTTNNRNQQLGISQWDDPDWLGRSFGGGGGKTTYDVKGGQPCIRTDSASGNPYINFDIDDTAAYRGLSGAVVMLSYFDQGTDSFAVELYNRQTSKYEVLKTFKKTNTNTWTRAYVALPWYDSAAPMDPMNNTWKDLRVNCLNDGDDAFANIQLNFAPLQSWAVDAEVTDLQNTAPNEWILRTKTQADMVQIPVATLDNGANSATLSVYTDGVIACSKSFSYVDSGDVWTLCLPPSLSNEYTLKLKVSSGTITLPRLDNQFSKATLLRYQSDEKGLILDDIQDGRFRARAPWHELQLPNNASGKYQLQRLCGDDWLNVAWLNLRKQKQISTMPMPAGIYRLYPALKPEVIGELLPQTTAPQTAPSEPIPGIELSKWNGLDMPTANAISLDSSRNLNIDADQNQYVRLTLRNNSSNTGAKIYWRSADQEFSEERCMPFQILPHDNELRNVRVFVSTNKAWTGKIDQIRVNMGGDWPNTGIISLKQIAVCQTTPFNAIWTNTEADHAAPFSTEFSTRSGRMEDDDKTGKLWSLAFTGDIASSQPANSAEVFPETVFTAPPFSVEPNANQMVKLRIQNGTGCRYADIMCWPKSGAAGWVGNRFALPATTDMCSIYVPISQNAAYVAGAAGIRLSFIDDRVGTAMLGEQRVGVQSVSLANCRQVLSWKDLKQSVKPVKLSGQIKAAPTQVLQVTITNTSEKQNLLINWGNQKISWPLLPGQQPQTLVVPIGEQPTWTGTVKDLSLSIEGAALPTNGLRAVLYDVTEVAVHTPIMGGDSMGWQHNDSLSTPHVSRSGELKLKVKSANAMLSRTLTKDEFFQAQPSQVMRIRLKNNTMASELKLSWTTSERPTESGTVTIPITPNSKSTDYIIPLGEQPAWAGTITALQLEPCVGVSKGDIGLSLVRIEGKSTLDTNN